MKLNMALLPIWISLNLNMKLTQPEAAVYQSSCPRDQLDASNIFAEQVL